MGRYETTASRAIEDRMPKLGGLRAACIALLDVFASAAVLDANGRQHAPFSVPEKALASR